MRSFLLVILLIPTLAIASEKSIESLRSISKAFSSVAKKSSPAVVFIQTEKKQQIGGNIHFFAPFGEGHPFGNDFFEHFFRGYGQQRPHSQKQERVVMGQGSGFIISKDGHILTNNHVVGDADKVHVKLLDGRSFEAKVIGKDEHSDIAVIKINASNLPVLELGDSDKLEVGEWVVALGNPFGLSHSLTAGVVSAKGRSSVGITNYENFIQTDSAINPGNSGGPLINLDGQAVGMNTAIFSRSGGYMGIGFAIPINMVKNIKKQLIEKGSVIRGYLGIAIQNIDKKLSEQFELKDRTGILVSDVGEDTPAEKSGFKNGDIILELNGKKVKEVGSFRNMIALTPPGEKVSIKILRDGDEKRLKVKLGKLPEKFGSSSKKSSSINDFGFSVIELSTDTRNRYNIDKGEKGVIVNQVNPSSAAHLAGLKPGNLIKEVNRIKINSVSSFKKALKKSKSKNTILLLVKDGEYSRYITISSN